MAYSSRFDLRSFDRIPGSRPRADLAHRMEEPAKKLLTDLPLDVLQHIVARIELAYHIGRAAPTCKVVSVAARNAIRVRQFSGEVMTLAGHTVVCSGERE